MQTGRCERSRCNFKLSVLGCLLAIVSTSLAFADDKTDDPFKARLNPAAAKASTEPVDPNAPLDLRIALEPSERLTLGAPGCPVVVVGTRIINVRSGTIRAQLDGQVDQNAVTALSDDGEYFAAGLKSANQENTPVCVWSTASGEKILDVPPDPKRFVDLMLFSRKKYLILGGRSTPDFQIWDLEAREAQKPIDVKSDRIEHGKAAFSSDGTNFLAVVKNKLTLFKTATGKPVIVMSPPRNLPHGMPDGPAAEGSTRGRGGVASPAAAQSMEAPFAYAWMQALCFSPDGKEIAAITTNPVPRLLVWDIKGKLLMDEPLGLPPMIFWQNTLQWLPDKSGWLVSGFIIDRATHRAIVGIRGKNRQLPRVCLFDADHLIGTETDFRGELRSYAIPWSDIRASIALMRQPNAALMGPSRPVSISAELGEQTGDAAQTAALLTDNLTKILHQDGIKVAPGSDLVFHLRYSEAAGDTLPIFEKQSPFDMRGRDTGRTIAERKGSLVIELTDKGQSSPLWRQALDANSSRSFREAINDSTIRKSMLASLTGQMRQLNIPYFIPRDDQHLALPVVLH